MKIIIISIFILAITITSCSCSMIKTKESQDIIGLEAAKAKAEEFINNNLLQPGTKATAKEITEENNLYKIVVSLSNGQEINSYLTKDGKKFFPQVLDIDKIEEQNQQKQTQEESTTVEMVKNDKPAVELFVMSHCPYGTQIEKGILPVIEVLGDKIDFKLKFCDYAMHGKKELDEQLNQYCIQKEEPSKLISYLTCFLEEGNGNECLEETGINKTELNLCVSAADKQFKVTEKYNDKSTWFNGSFPTFDVNKTDVTKYGVKGSPGLVINGKKDSSGRSPSALLSAICAGFNEQPDECSQELSVQTPSPGFGFSGSGSDSGDCSS